MEKEILDTQATLVRKITSIDRFFPEYFRVGFYGKGFDIKLQVILLLKFNVFIFAVYNKL
jgi:hypothetical protein